MKALPLLEERPPRPAWLTVRAPAGQTYTRLKAVLAQAGLHTICEEAHCPNIGECWRAGTATFLILGDLCTRNCRFCAVKSGRPAPPDPAEPQRLAQAVAAMGLRHAVITSVNRDDLADGGASQFSDVIAAINRVAPQTVIEVLIPDLQGNWQALSTILNAGPQVLNHNLETVPRLYPKARYGSHYNRSLDLFRQATRQGYRGLLKSGLMVGLGEEWEELVESIGDLASAGVTMLTVGQYLSPGSRHLPVVRYYSPEEFLQLERIAYGLGFTHVASGPLVRSSYHADRQLTHLQAS